MKRRKWIFGAWALLSVIFPLGLVVGLTECGHAPEYPKLEVTVFSDKPFLDLLKKYATQDGLVDYERWKEHDEDREALRKFTDILANVSPENRLDLFPDKASRRAYWITAYNALVIREVLTLWPIESVRNVTKSALSFVIPGKGFFYDRKIVVGDRVTSLYELENDVIRKQINDPRVHFALNCASESCPSLRAVSWSEEDLVQATSDFIHDSKNVRIDEEARTLYLSKIFDWYKEDFTSWVRRPNATLLDFLLAYARAPLGERLRAAREKGYEIRYLDYDWSLNRSK